MHALSLGLYFAVVMILAVGVVRHPEVSLTAVCCMFALDQWGETAHPWLAAHSSVSNILIGSLVCLAIASKRLRDGRFGFVWSKDLIAVGALFTYSFASVIWTPRPDLALPLWQHQAPYVITVILLVPATLASIAHIRRALLWLVCVGGALVFGVLGLGDWGYRGLVIGSGAGDGVGNPLALATFGGLVACSAIFVGSQSRANFWRIGTVCVAAAGTLLVFRTESRGQLFGLIAAISISVLFILPLSKRRSVTTAFFVAIAVGSAMFMASTERVAFGSGRWTEDKLSGDLEGRLSMALALLRVWEKSGIAIWFGLGNSAAFDPRIVGFYPHMLPLEILGEEGLIGAACYVTILVLALRNILTLKRKIAESAMDPGLVAAIASILVFTFLASLKEGNLIGNLFFFLATLIASRAANSGPAPLMIKSEIGSANIPTNVLR